jgi:hypothetical protein
MYCLLVCQTFDPEDGSLKMILKNRKVGIHTYISTVYKLFPEVAGDNNCKSVPLKYVGIRFSSL